MRLGFNLPQMGPASSPENLIKAAQRAEELGYDSVWVTERLLFPVAPRTPYMATPDGSLPEVYKIVLDPIETLTFVAAHTKTVALGTSVLDIPYYNPVMLARRLTTLDVLSGGRLRVGMGQGWSEDEHEAVGASLKGRGKRADEFIQVLKAIWTTDPVEFKGEYYTVPKSFIQPKPVQQPHPPIYLAAYAPSALKRVASLADGWLPAGLPHEALKQMAGGLRSMAEEAGRNPDEIAIVVRANLDVTEQERPADGFPFTGTPAQVKADIEATREYASELHFDPSFTDDGETIDGFLESMERMMDLAG